MPKRRLCIGVDIGASSIKLCQLEQRGDSYALQKLAQLALPPETIVDGAVLSASRVVDGLRALFRTERIRHKQVAVSVSGHSVIIKKLSLPQMPREELESTVMLEAEELLPFDIRDVYFDVQELPAEAGEAAGPMNVLFVAAKKDYVHEYTSVLAEAGLTPTVCDVDPLALETAYLYGCSGGKAPSETIALVHVGAAKTVLNILAGGVTGLTRELAVGGNTFTEGLQRALKISFEQAERYKLGQGRDIGAAEATQKANASLLETTDLLADELQASFDIFAASDAHGAPQSLVLSGGSSRMPGLEQRLGERLGLPVELFDPFAQLTGSAVNDETRARMRHVAAVAVGLAMRWPGDC